MNLLWFIYHYSLIKIKWTSDTWDMHINLKAYAKLQR